MTGSNGRAARPDRGGPGRDLPRAHVRHGESSRTQGPGDDALVVPVSRRVDITRVRRLVVRLARREPRLTHVVCDVTHATQCDAAAVGELARIALEGRRHGVRVWVRNPSPALVELVELVGLTDALPVCGPARPAGRAPAAE